MTEWKIPQEPIRACFDVEISAKYQKWFSYPSRFSHRALQFWYAFLVFFRMQFSPIFVSTDSHCSGLIKSLRLTSALKASNPGVFIRMQLLQKRILVLTQKFLSTPLDEALLAVHVLPVYKRLSDLDLLKRCEDHVTSNSNESLHSSLWARCPKTSFYSRRRVEFIVMRGISDFNFGPSLNFVEIVCWGISAVSPKKEPWADQS